MRAPEVLWRTLHDGVLLLGADDEVRVLSGSGAALWDLLAEPSSVDDLVRALSLAHQTPAATVADGLATLLDDLARSGLVERLP